MRERGEKEGKETKTDLFDGCFSTNVMVVIDLRGYSICLLAEVLLYVHRNRRFIRDGSPERPPRLSHSS